MVRRQHRGWNMAESFSLPTLRRLLLLALELEARESEELALLSTLWPASRLRTRRLSSVPFNKQISDR
jgi:hypothetical protein